MQHIRRTLCAVHSMLTSMPGTSFSTDMRTWRNLEGFGMLLDWSRLPWIRRLGGAGYKRSLDAPSTRLESFKCLIDGWAEAPGTGRAAAHTPARTAGQPCERELLAVGPPGHVPFWLPAPVQPRPPAAGGPQHPSAAAVPGAASANPPCSAPS